MKKTERGSLRRPLKRFMYVLLAVYTAFVCTLGAIDYVCPDTLSVYGRGICQDEAAMHLDAGPTAVCCTSQKTMLTIGGMIPIKEVTVNAYEERLVYPGGMLFGVRCAMDGVLVVGFEDVKDGMCPAKESGLRIGDLITAVDGKEIRSVKALSDAVADAGKRGEAAVFSVQRDGEVLSLPLTPCKAADGGYRAGVWSRDSMAGIGTVTFIDPETMVFGGLGHGICDIETGALLPLSRGSTMDVTIGEIIPGSVGKPGELHGQFATARTGTLMKNTTSGVFGIFSAAKKASFAEPIPVGRASDVHEGDAQILCTVCDGAAQLYSVRIIDVARGGGSATKNFIVEVTDDALLSKTGGIIQGMSGSPIIQDGKLVGAVTHVLINDPTKGYGIFIENMLEAAENGIN